MPSTVQRRAHDWNIRIPKRFKFNSGRGKKSCSTGKDPVPQNRITNSLGVMSNRAFRIIRFSPYPSPRTCQTARAEMKSLNFGMFLEGLFLIDHDLTEVRSEGLSVSELQGSEYPKAKRNNSGFFDRFRRMFSK